MARNFTIQLQSRGKSGFTTFVYGSSRTSLFFGLGLSSFLSLPISRHPILPWLWRQKKKWLHELPGRLRCLISYKSRTYGFCYKFLTQTTTMCTVPHFLDNVQICFTFLFCFLICSNHIKWGNFLGNFYPTGPREAATAELLSGRPTARAWQLNCTWNNNFFWPI